MYTYFNATKIYDNATPVSCDNLSIHIPCPVWHTWFSKFHHYDYWAPPIMDVSLPSLNGSCISSGFQQQMVYCYKHTRSSQLLKTCRSSSGLLHIQQQRLLWQFCKTRKVVHVQYTLNRNQGHLRFLVVMQLLYSGKKVKNGITYRGTNSMSYSKYAGSWIQPLEVAEFQQ